MKIGSYELTIRKATPNVPGNTPTLLPPYSGYGGWWNIIRESFPGAWQRNVEIRLDNVMTFAALYACVTLIASDIGKLCLQLVEKDKDDIWQPIDNPAFSPVLRKPNHFQTRQKFIENWVTSKLMHGNTYVLKARDNRKVVTALTVLDPQVTRVLIAPDGDVFYQLSTNRLAGIDGLIGVDMTEVTQGALYVPASEIIHDVYTPLYHPLCGVSPISACGLAACQGLAMLENSTKFFNNGSQPGGVLVAPGTISEANALALKQYWEQNFTGDNAGRIAVLSDGLTYTPMTVSASDAQFVNQLKLTAETCCTAFKVPGFMVGVGPQPQYSDVYSLRLFYYEQCLQPLMEAIEALLDEGLGMIGPGFIQTMGTEFDLDDLLKMDTSTQYKTFGEGVARGILAPNEARAKVGYGPVKGGKTPYLQQQNYSLAALDKRDAKEDPFSSKTNAPPQPVNGAAANGAPPPAANENATAADENKQLHTVEWLAGIKAAVKHARTS